MNKAILAFSSSLNIWPSIASAFARLHRIPGIQCSGFVCPSSPRTSTLIYACLFDRRALAYWQIDVLQMCHALARIMFILTCSVSESFPKLNF